MYYMLAQAEVNYTLNAGLKQGCVLSSLLFCLYINDLPHVFDESHYHVAVGKHFTNVIMYADDLVLMSNS